MIEVEGIGRPELRPELVTRDQLTGSLDQPDQSSKWLLLQRDTPTLLAQLARTSVEFENAEADAIGRKRSRGHCG